MNQDKRRQNLRKLVTMAMLAGMSYLLMFVLQIPLIPAAPFLKYDPSDVPTLIGSLMLGPLAGGVIALVKVALFFLTKGTGGPIGSIQNLLASATFAFVTGLVYRKLPNKWGALLGMVAGGLVMSVVMYASNLYWALAAWGVPHAQHAELLWTAIVPFNAARAALSTLITLPLYLALAPFLKRFSVNS
ncbi:MAG: Riboflavin transporter RibU [Firmicutes bacterium]|nr:Riboflavin transporter RibU [candidate division NPL-UPA2 bacterium]MBT9155344.1 Riboflavin transporter RibU [candidate division NPL-UPA2 bacterium]